MRPQLRAQLRRQKARPKSGFEYWVSGWTGISVPWTVGQRKWMDAKMKEALKGLFRQREFFAESRPDTMIMSRDAYDAFKSALNSPD